MEIKNTLIGVIVGVVLAAAFIFAVGQKGGAISGGAGDFNVFSLYSTSTVRALAATGATQLLPANSGRTYAKFTNDCATAVYITGATTTAATPVALPNFGIRLNANGGEYTIDNRALYNGAVFASSTVTGCSVLVVEN